MSKNLSPYAKYKSDFFRKLDIPFAKGSRILDVGCGDGGDAKLFINKYNLQTYACDIFKDTNIKDIKGLHFKLGGIYQIPFEDNSFDMIFLHDVLHHIDEEKQRFSQHRKGLLELKRVCKNGGKIIVVEANRYNPLFYPHMVLINKHNHFTQAYFKKLFTSVFPNVTFKHFESHVYPTKLKQLWSLYEGVMEHIVPVQFRAYNVAVVTNIKTKGKN